jgi:nitrate/TMAO reductase-like tetraheme cytochrome c subunit
MKLGLGRKSMMGAIGTLVAVGLGLAVVGAAGIAGWEYTNSDEFCAVMCHSVHPEESIAHTQAAHARVRCVECHMGRNSTLKLIAMKPTHFKELWGMIAGYERPLHASGMRPAREACESCHWPEAVHDDKVSVHKRYGTDAKSTEIDYRLMLHTSANVERAQPWKVTGIHWHIANDVQYKTTDVQGREIPWIQVTKPDGTKVTYVDAATKLSAAELGQLEPRRMECFNCHNQVGHPFPNPAYKVDQAIAEERISRDIPGVKGRAVALIDAADAISGPRDERAAAIAKLVAEHAAKNPVPADFKEKDAQFQKEMKAILLEATFDEKGFSWKSFPNHAQHADSPGCFRCHSGRHVNEQGEAIRLQCTLCHDLPQVRLEGGGGSVPSLIVAGVTPPASHNEPNFMHDHRFKLDDTCAMCHGKIEFGREGGSFCSNPACHGRAWPGVNLNVEFKTAQSEPAPAAAAAKDKGGAAKAAAKDAKSGK